MQFDDCFVTAKTAGSGNHQTSGFCLSLIGNLATSAAFRIPWHASFALFASVRSKDGVSFNSFSFIRKRPFHLDSFDIRRVSQNDKTKNETRRSELIHEQLRDFLLAICLDFVTIPPYASTTPIHSL